MDRRKFLVNSSFFTALLPNCMLSAETIEPTRDPHFLFDRDAPGVVYFLDRQGKRVDVLNHSILFGEDCQFKYDDNSYLSFITGSNQRTIGVLAQLPFQERHPHSPISGAFDPFEWTQFGFLFWNEQTQKLELEGVLNRSSEIRYFWTTLSKIMELYPHCRCLVSRKHTL